MKKGIKIRLLLAAIIISYSLCLNGCKENSTEPESEEPVNYDYSYIYKYNSSFNMSKFTIIKENKYSRFMIMPSYMSDYQISKLAANVDTVISRICVYFNTGVEKEYNGFKGKVSYFVEPGIIPRCYGGSSIPIVSITNDASLASMYNHETVHIFSMNTTSTWLIEGLAVHLADTLGVEKLWPNYSENLHLHAKNFINSTSYSKALFYIGLSGYYNVDPTTSVGEAFYTLSGSFVRYLICNIGKTNFMKCYSSSNFQSSLYTATQKTFDDWEKEWINYLTALKY
jgi:hypothetical protein